MSRFVELLNEENVIISLSNLNTWVKKIAIRLHATQSYLKVRFPLFIEKMAPVTKVKGLMDYEVILEGFHQQGAYATQITLVIPVTSLCPCSKEISAFGAHNQRSHITVTLQISAPISLRETIQLVESKASSELYSILKRQDEKEVTEKAYLNPKFVEDLVRDIATSLSTQPLVLGYKISSENFESIHNHSAFAEINRLKVLSDVIKQTAVQEVSEEVLEEIC
jgi:GTP cyclohydrolase I